jgi:MFS family permease
VLILGTFATVTTFLLFYLLTVFTLDYGTKTLHYSRTSFLIGEMIANVFFGLGIPLSAILADKYGRSKILIIATIGIFIFGLVFSPLFVAGNWGMTVGFLVLGMFLMGLTYGPLGTALAEIFPASVRYTGASLSFTLAGILGASLTPLLATKLAGNYGLPYVGYYLSIVAAITFLALLAARGSMKENAPAAK